MKRSLILLLILCGTFSLSGFSQKVYKMGVIELFDKGIQNSVLIKQSIVKTRISRDQLGLAKNMRIPDIRAGIDFGYVGKLVQLDRNLSFISHPYMPNTKDEYAINATQPIYEGGRITHSIDKAKLEDEFARLSLDNDKSKLKLWLVNKYLMLFNLYKQKEVYQNNIQEAKKRVEDVSGMYKQGIVTNNDVLRSQLVLTNYKILLKETLDDIVIQSQRLDIVLGMDETTQIEPDTTLLSKIVLIKSENEYVNKAYMDYPAIKMTRKNIELAENNLKLKRADYLPSLSLTAGNDFARPILLAVPVPVNTYLNTWGVTLNLSYRFSALFDKKHSMGAARKQIILSQLGEVEQKENIRRDVKAAFVKHYEAKDRVDLLQESVIQAKENYRIVKNKYYNQLAILTDLLDANTMELNAELQLTAARANVLYTYYQLQEISGEL